MGIVCRRSSCCCLGDEKRFLFIGFNHHFATVAHICKHNKQFLNSTYGGMMVLLFSFLSIFVPEHRQSNTPFVWHDNLSFFTLDLRDFFSLYITFKNHNDWIISCNFLLVEAKVRPSTSSHGRINFVAAKQKQITDQVASRTRRRGQVNKIDNRSVIEYIKILICVKNYRCFDKLEKNINCHLSASLPSPPQL